MHAMSRKSDLKWFLQNREEMASKHHERWVVVLDGEVVSAFDSEEEAFLWAVEKHGIDVASIFFASTEDPISLAG